MMPPAMAIACMEALKNYISSFSINNLNTGAQVYTCSDSLKTSPLHEDNFFPLLHCKFNLMWIILVLSVTVIDIKVMSVSNRNQLGTETQRKEAPEFPAVERLLTFLRCEVGVDVSQRRSQPSFIHKRQQGHTFKNKQIITVFRMTSKCCEIYRLFQSTTLSVV